MIEVLERREAAALERVEELRAEALAVADRLDAARIELSNVVVARLTVIEVLAGMPEESAVSGAAPVVPMWGGSVRDEAVCAWIVDVFRRDGGPLKAREVCDALGLPEGRNATESMRAKLKRLVADGTLVEVEPRSGMFALLNAGVVA